MEVVCAFSGLFTRRAPPKYTKSRVKGMFPSPGFYIQSSGGTASWKLSQVCPAASTAAQVYPAFSHSAQVR